MSEQESSSIDCASPSAANRSESRTTPPRLPTIVILAMMTAVVAGALAGVQPTGSSVVDLLIVVFACGLVTWAWSTAPWWLSIVAAGLTLATVGAALPIMVAGAGLALAFVGAYPRSWNVGLSAVVGALSVSALCYSDLRLGGFASSSIIGLGIGCAICVSWLGHASAPTRRRVFLVSGSALVALVVMAIVASVALLRASSRMRDAEAATRRGIQSLSTDGSMADALVDFDAAQSDFATAAQLLDGPWGFTARLLPIAAQHRSAASAIARSGRDTFASVAAVVRTVDTIGPLVSHGRVDVQRLQKLTPVIHDLTMKFEALGGVLHAQTSPWLLPRFSNEIDQLTMEVDRQLGRVRLVDQGLLAFPAILGAPGVRTYLLVFTTPAEARGIGGLVGNYAELVVSDGSLDLRSFGRSATLNDRLRSNAPVVIDLPSDFTKRYGQYTLLPDGTVAPFAWSNASMAADFRLSAAAFAELYPASGGRAVDGVIMLDPFVLEALAALGGPLEIPSIGMTLQPGSTAQFLLAGQYLLDQEQRVDVIEEVATTTFDRLTSGGTSTSGADLLRAFLPLAQQGRLRVWMKRPDEQQAIESLGLSGRLPELNGRDGLAVTLNNGSGNKIDTYLQRDVAYSVVGDAAGVLSATTTVSLTNTAPSSGLPDVVIGNLVGLPTGTNRTIVSIYTSGPVSELLVDGVSVPFANEEESGWNVVTQRVTIPAGSTVVVTARSTVSVAGPYRLIVEPQPLVLPAHLKIQVATCATGGTIDVPAFIDPVAASC